MKGRVDLLVLMSLLAAFLAWCSGRPALAEGPPPSASVGSPVTEEVPLVFRPPGAFDRYCSAAAY